MTNRKNLWLGMIVVVVLLALLVGCAAPEATPTPGPKVLKLAFIGAQTTWSAPWGHATTYPGVLYIEKINAEGGLLVNGERYKIEAIIEDDRADPTTARSCAEKVIYRDKVKFITATFDTLIATYFELARDNKVIQIYGATTTKLFDSRNPYGFSVMPQPVDLAPGFYDAILKEHPEAKSALSIAGRGETGESLSAASEAAAKAHGLKWLGTEFYDFGTMDYMPIITRVLAKEPDIIDIGYGVAALMTLPRQLGYKGVLCSSGTHDVAMRLRDTSPEVAEGFYQADGTHYPPTPAMEEFMKEYEALTGEWFGYAVPYWYGIRLILQGIQNAGTVDDTESIRDAIEQIEIQSDILPGAPVIGWGGAKTYGQAHQFLVPHCVNVIRDGKPITIDIVYPEVP